MPYSFSGSRKERGAGPAAGRGRACADWLARLLLTAVNGGRATGSSGWRERTIAHGYPTTRKRTAGADAHFCTAGQAARARCRQLPGRPTPAHGQAARSPFFRQRKRFFDNLILQGTRAGSKLSYLIADSLPPSTDPNGHVVVNSRLSPPRGVGNPGADGSDARPRPAFWRRRPVVRGAGSRSGWQGG